MRYLGIDYGSKKVGLALSDEGGKLAFPKVVLKNDEYLLSAIKEIRHEEKVDEIVMGESLTLSGEPNEIMKEIKEFKVKLEEEFNLPVHLEKEFLTTVEARRRQGYDGQARRRPARVKIIPTKKRKEPVDAIAAALILQRHLDKLQ